MWLDDTEDNSTDDADGDRRGHMPFKLSSKGDSLLLWYSTDADAGADQTNRSGSSASAIPQLVDCWGVPPLRENEVFGRFPDGIGAPQQCPYASAGKPNPDVCGADLAGVKEYAETFTPFIWSAP